ncbi:efflux RND transporter periplasmic adaptor subunit [Oscillospiraceae bacterium MB08-C2-2]|nr:efflux RND transporter periplasmic adaptor subunit [Oscillospiraceae bacterium MB08-C2-2]
MTQKLNKPIRKKVISLSAIALAGGLVALSAFTFGNQKEETTETVYRENTVTRGDLVVGVTESATATLKTHNITFDTSAEIEEVFVKAGQRVSEGDPIVSLSLESLQENYESLQTDYKKLQLEYEQAKVDQQLGQIEAKQTYDSAVAKSGNADSTYSLTIEKLELAITRAKTSMSEIRTKIRSYTKAINDMDDGYYDDLDDAKEEYEAVKAELTAAKKELLKATDQDEIDALSEKVNDLEAATDYAEAVYEGLSDEVTTDYSNMTTEELISKRQTAKEDLEDAYTSLEEAENNLELKKLEAEQTKDNTLSSGDNAQIVYDMTLSQLQNSLTSKELSLNSAKKSLDEVAAYLNNGVLTAPCDGVVASVSYSAGDTAPANNAIAVISDSSNVFVYVSVAQDDISSISLGQEATLTMDAFEDETFTGIIDSISTTPARSASGTASYNVTVKVEGDVAQIFEGMTGSLTLITRQQQNVLYVSNRTVYEKDGQQYVKVKTESGEISEALVETGFSDGRNVEITSGLEEGQTVLIESQVVSAQ